MFLNLVLILWRLDGGEFSVDDINVEGMLLKL